MNAKKDHWRRISLRVAPPREGLSFREAAASPCLSCATASCCTHLTLHEFEVDALTDLDYARYVLNFDRMLLGIKHDGKWGVYYRNPCRYLARDTLRCTVHDTPTQPNICKSFNPYACWYAASYSGPVSDTLIQIDRIRLDWILERARFRDDRSLEALPSTDEMRAVFPTLPVVEDPDDTVDQLAAERVYPAWRASVTSGGPIDDARDRSFAELDDPCNGCGAYCCTALVFPQRAPFNHAQVDYFRYALGFPGIELGVNPGGVWSLSVLTKCRHLEGTRCGVHGKPDRPLMCHYYDAHKCAYKHQFGQQRPSGFVRVRYEEFEAVAGAFRFSETGMTTHTPDADEVRAAIETSWRAATPG